MKINKRVVKFHFHKNTITFYVGDFSKTYKYNNYEDETLSLHETLLKKFMIEYENKDIINNKLEETNRSLFTDQCIKKEDSLFNIHNSTSYNLNLFDNKEESSNNKNITKNEKKSSMDLSIIFNKKYDIKNIFDIPSDKK